MTIPQQLRRGLVAYWPLAPASSGAISAVAAKSALYGGEPFDITSVNSPTQTDGPSDNLPNAVRLVAASSQYLDATTSPPLPNASFTFLWWMRAPSTPAAGERILDMGTAAGQRSMDCIWAGATAFNFRVSLDGTNLTSVSVFPSTISAWALFIGQYDLPAGELFAEEYHTGSPATAAHVGGVANNSQGLHIGASHTPGNYSDIDVTGLCIWRRLLSDAEKTWLYNDGNGRDLLRGV